MKSLSGANWLAGAPKAIARDCELPRSVGRAISNHCRPVPRVSPEVRYTRPAAELMTIAVGSIGLTAKLTVPRYGHWPVPAGGLSVPWIRPVVRLWLPRLTPF